MDSTELTIEVLKGIRSDIQGLGQNLGERIDQTNERLDQTNERLDRLAEGQIRMATQLSDRIQRVEHRVGGLEGEVRNLNARLDNVLIGPAGKMLRDHEDRISTIEARLPAG